MKCIVCPDNWAKELKSSHHFLKVFYIGLKFQLYIAFFVSSVRAGFSIAVIAKML